MCTIKFALTFGPYEGLTPGLQHSISLETPFVCASFFPFFLPLHYPSPGNFLASFIPKTPSFWTSEILFSSRGKGSCMGWLLGRDLDRVAPQKKGVSFQNGAAKKKVRKHGPNTTTCCGSTTSSTAAIIATATPSAQHAAGECLSHILWPVLTGEYLCRILWPVLTGSLHQGTAQILGKTNTCMSHINFPVGLKLKMGQTKQESQREGLKPTSAIVASSSMISPHQQRKHLENSLGTRQERKRPCASRPQQTDNIMKLE